MPSAVGRTDAAPHGGARQTILLADDDEVVRSFVARVLAHSGYDVLTACDGQDAVELFAARVASVAMAVLDVAMPRMNGVAAAERMRAVRPSLPVLFFTGYDFHLLERGYSPKPGMEVLLKPFTHEDLLHRIRALLGSETGPSRAAR
jgi:two-component system, cell cycle sensor histidine kinase and response regulator CckA